MCHHLFVRLMLLPSPDQGQGTPRATAGLREDPGGQPTLPEPARGPAWGHSHPPVHAGQVPPEVPCPVRCGHFFGIDHDGIGLREGEREGQRGWAAPGRGGGTWGSPGLEGADPRRALTSRKREMSLLSLTPMATTFSKSQKKGRSSPSLGRASCSRR